MIPRRPHSTQPPRRQPPPLPQQALGESLHDLATYLSPTGNRPEALATIREATEIRRELARHDPGSFIIDLARSLDVCAAILDWCGQPKQAARIRQELNAVASQIEAEGNGRD